MLIFGVLLSIVRGMTFPMFSIIYGQMFNVSPYPSLPLLFHSSQSLSTGSDEDKLNGARMNAIYFTLIGTFPSPSFAINLFSSGCSAFISTFISGYLFGRAGEFITRRMRISLFTNIITQVSINRSNEYRNQNILLRTENISIKSSIRPVVSQRDLHLMLPISER